MDMKEDVHMDFDLYTKIIDECAENNLFTLKFSMRAEPTMNPRIVDMIAYAKEKNIKEVWLNTHGGHLTESKTEALLKTGVDHITVSFDGLGEVYESIRMPLKYDDQIMKLKRLVEMRDKLKSKTRIKVQSLWSAIQHNPHAYISLMSKIVDEVAYNVDFNYKEITLVSDPTFVCYRLWHRLAITSNGDVLKCPSDFEKDEVLANVRDKSLKEIWDQEQQRNREKHLNHKKDESIPCKKCHHGAIEVPREIEFEGKKLAARDVAYQKDFRGHGLLNQ
jgi:radical SAM protein with 4Fe4S-binding SPASM domain